MPSTASQRIDDFLSHSSRWRIHLLFWAGYYVYRVIIYGDVVNTYANVAWVQLLEMPVKLLAVYLNLYVLMPRLLMQGCWIWYITSIVLTIVLGGLLQYQAIELCVWLGIYAPFPGLNWPKYFSIVSHIQSILLITAIAKIFKNAYVGQKQTQLLAREKLENELKYLRAQIHPHFFFNTLNSLYALTLKKSEQAPEVVLRLSALMSYMLYDTKHDQVPLANEVQMLKDYIALEMLRLDKHVQIEAQLDHLPDNLQIAPTLLLPFVENSFKHLAADEGKQRWIRISLAVSAQPAPLLVFTVENSQSSVEGGGLVPHSPPTKGGIGLENIQRRLELLYTGRYRLEINDEAKRFAVKLVLYQNESEVRQK